MTLERPLHQVSQFRGSDSARCRSDSLRRTLPRDVPMTIAPIRAAGLRLAALRPRFFPARPRPRPPTNCRRPGRTIAFSVENMGAGVEPAAASYATLGRLARPGRAPETFAQYGIFNIVGERLRAQMQIVLSQAAPRSRRPPKEVPRDRSARSTTPIWTRRRATPGDRPDPAPVRRDRRDRVAPPPPPPPLRRPAGLATARGLRTYLAQIFEIAGYAPAETERIAGLAISIGSELHAAKLAPAEATDPRNIYNPLPYADIRAQVPGLDLSLFQAIGYPVPEQIIQTEPYLARPIEAAARTPAAKLQGLRRADADPENQGVLTQLSRSPSARSTRPDRRSVPAPARGSGAVADHTVARPSGQPTLCRGISSTILQRRRRPT